MNRIKNLIRTLHEDDAGEMPIGPMLIIGLIVIPLVIIIAGFRDDLDTNFGDWMTSLWGEDEIGTAKGK